MATPDSNQGELEPHHQFPEFIRRPHGELAESIRNQASIELGLYPGLTIKLAKGRKVLVLDSESEDGPDTLTIVHAETLIEIIAAKRDEDAKATEHCTLRTRPLGWSEFTNGCFGDVFDLGEVTDRFERLEQFTKLLSKAIPTESERAYDIVQQDLAARVLLPVQ
ncbi:hypothetical protein EXS54_02790 [Patescibacteria group bacterium]|nr:hypothetical protein [Patescibacteria group bacterium]